MIIDIKKNIDELRNQDAEDYYIGFLASEELPIELNTTIEEVNNIFSEKYNLQGIPVVAEKRPVGLVMRTKFYYQILRKNIEGNCNLPISTMMTKLPLIVDFNSPAKQVARMVLARKEESLYDFIIVVKDNEYYGIVSVASLLDSLS